jgi:uroporphyrinogen decarboxylase
MLSFISLFETYCGMRGLENALADLYVEETLAEYALERIAVIQLAYIDGALAAAGTDIDIVYFSDDMGMQDRQMFATEAWDRFIGPRAERIIDLVHRHGKKVFYHTDGSAPEIVDRLVGMGIDILNPIQHRCPGMERERLKKLYGNKVVFHGAVENQEVLPFGTPAEVRKETLDCMRILGEGGGYIVASCHNLQPNTPVENVLAMYEAVREAGDRFF